MKKVRKYFYGHRTKDGAGVSLKRCIDNSDTEDFDPFLMMDFFDSNDPEEYIKGFPWHPHRGIETITYLINGEIIHEDSLSNTGKITPGSCQWMKAGSGILHQEMPQKSNNFLGCQIWLNMPGENKMDPPSYMEIDSKRIDVFKDNNLEVRVIAGEFRGIIGKISREKTDPTFLDIKLEPGKEFIFRIKSDYNSFIYLFRGDLQVDTSKIDLVKAPMGILYHTEGNLINIKAGERGARLFLLSGKPLKEEIAWGGPIVMNTKSELELAFQELRDGNFIK